MLNKENYGKPIGKELSNNLRKYISKDDIANISTPGASGDYIKKVIYRTVNLTENNEKAISKLTSVAIENCAKIIHDAKEASKFFEKIIKQ